MRYPESGHDRGIPVDQAGPEHIRVPPEEQAEFKLGKDVCRYRNRWAAGEVGLRLEF